MFDLITGNVIRAPCPRVTPVIVSIGAHAAIVGAVLVGAVVFVAAPVPELPMMMAFVAPPPPPQPAPLARQPAKQQAAKPVPTSGDVAPMAPPGEIEAEPAFDEDEIGGVEGGVPGGIMGGVEGGPMPEVPPPPSSPPPPPEAPRGPIRVGGQIKEPTLIHRVEPEYPLRSSARSKAW